MDYKIDEKNHEIFIYGNPKEIRKWIYCVDAVVSNGKMGKRFKESLNDLENIVNFCSRTRMIPTDYLRIYFKNTEMVWFPNNYNLGKDGFIGI